MGLFRRKAKTGENAVEAAGHTTEGKQGKPGFKEKKSLWVITGIAVSLAGAVIFSSRYGAFRDSARQEAASSVNSSINIAWLYQTCYLLYGDLYHLGTGSYGNYTDVYMELDDAYQWLLDDNYMGDTEQLFEEAERDGISYEEAFEKEFGISQEKCDTVRHAVTMLGECFDGLEIGFRSLNSHYDYVIRDNKTGGIVSNIEEGAVLEAPKSTDYFFLSFSFDSSGHVTVKDAVCEQDSGALRKTANEVIHEDNVLQRFLNEFQGYGTIRMPSDCTVTYRITREDWQAGKGNYTLMRNYVTGDGNGYYCMPELNPDGGFPYGMRAYQLTGVIGVFCLVFFAVALFGLFLPLPGGARPWEKNRLCALPLEMLVGVGICAVGIFGSLIVPLVAWVAELDKGLDLISFTRWLSAWIANLLALCAMLFVGWYLGICLRAARDKGIRGYIRERSLIYRFFPFMKNKAVGAYRAIEHLDLTQEANKAILKIILLNAVILFVISSLWFGGFAITVIYSAVLYFILRNYISRLQKRYQILLKATNEIAEGNLNVKIEEDLGVFEPFKPQVIKIQNGFQKAVDEEVKSQRMKAELITNVSHDLKTPLTAIITYVGLLKEEKSEEKRKEYLDILERKSLRLKSLIEDLFEVSKANSQNIVLNKTNVDIMNLIRQVAFEMSDKLTAAKLDMRMNLTEEKVILSLDSQKTYRIYENLFGNIAKYAMPGTRIYVNGFRIDDRVVITLKNISANEITVDSAELTERFVRGDAARNTEGSGLGLAIAKSFAELQGGKLAIDIDGDLFKVTTTWTVEAEEK